MTALDDARERGKWRLATRLNRDHGDGLRYVPYVGWFALDGTTWTRDDHDQGLALVDRVLADAALESVLDDRPDLAVSVAAFHDPGTHRLILALASTMSPIKATPTDVGHDEGETP